MTHQYINTELAPQAVGCYSQAVKTNNTVYLSGQVGLDPQTMQLADGVAAQMHQSFKNLLAIASASGGNSTHFVKLNVYLTTMDHFALLNEIMANYFSQPYPARAAIAVVDLPKQALFEVEGILVI